MAVGALLMPEKQEVSGLVYAWLERGHHVLVDEQIRPVFTKRYKRIKFE